MSVNPIPKLPVFKTIAEVFTVTFRHLGDLLRFAWPWLLVLIAVSGALYAAYYDSERTAIAAGDTGSNSLWVLTLAVSTTLGALIAVPWHRRILLGEHQTLSKSLSLDATKFAYTAKAAAIIAVLCLPLVVVKLADPVAPETQATIDLLITVIFTLVFLTLFFASNRISLILPATAVENHAVTLGDAWRATRGNTLRLALVSIVSTIVPLMIPLLLAYWLAPAAAAAMDANTAPSAATFAVANTIWELFAIVFGMLFVTFLSLAYRHFFEPVRGNDASVSSPRP
jgi:hypothetical protein